MQPSTRHGRGICWHILLTSLLISLIVSSFSAPSVQAFDPVAPPDVSARAVFSIDVTADVVLYQKNPDERLQPASTTKIATALVVLAHVEDLGAQVTIAASDVVDANSESHMGIQAGEVWTVEDLLYGLMIPSGNDAALALARYVGGTLGGGDPMAAFVAEMNALAASIELPNTHFTNPVGLADDPNHYTSARDLAMLAKRLMENELIRKIVRQPTVTLTSKGPEQRTIELATTNERLGQNGVHGLKTGSTGVAGGCLVIASWTHGRNRVITVLLGSDIAYDASTGERTVDARWPDLDAILAGLEANFRWVAPGEDEVPGLGQELAAWQVELHDPMAIVVPASGDGELRYRLKLGPPGDPRSQVGSVLFFVGSEQIAELPVFQKAVAASTEAEE